jgi:hypothetical protein
MYKTLQGSIKVQVDGFALTTTFPSLLFATCYDPSLQNTQP